MRWLQRKHIRVLLLGVIGITLMVILFSHPQKDTNVAVETGEKHYPGRQLHRYKLNSDYFKAQAEEALKKFRFADDGPAPDQFEEIEVDPGFRRKKPTPPPRIRPIELQTSLYFMSDDGRYDALQNVRCAHDKHYHVNGSSTCADPEIYTKKPFNLTIWSMDYSAGTIADLKFLLQPMGVKFIDKSLSPNCHVFGTCSNNIRGIDPLSGLFLKKVTMNNFQTEHMTDWEFKSADVMLCVRPSAMCELYMPFGKSMILNIDTRYEFGRWNMDRWRKWNENLEKISKDPNNFVSATSQFDIEYTRFFSGYGPSLLRPYCGYIKHSYNPQTSSHFLLSPIRLYKAVFETGFMFEFNKYSGIENSSALLTSMTQYRFDQSAETLTRYSGIVMIPYQVSSLRMTEFYRMNIPLFVPSLELLTRWQTNYGIIVHMNWQRIARHINPSALTSMPGKVSIPNPNDDRNKDSVGFWLNYADFYTWPHTIRFHSIQDLVKKLQDYSTSGKLTEVSRKMAHYNKEAKMHIKKRWELILRSMQNKKEARNRHNPQ